MMVLMIFQLIKYKYKQILLMMSKSKCIKLLISSLSLQWWWPDLHALSFPCYSFAFVCICICVCICIGFDISMNMERRTRWLFCFPFIGFVGFFIGFLLHQSLALFRPIAPHILYWAKASTKLQNICLSLGFGLHWK